MKIKNHIIILAVIVISYSIVAFYNLGNTFAPKTFSSLEDKDNIIIDFGKVMEFTRINYYKGIGVLLMSYETSEDGETWEDVFPIVTNYGTPLLNQLFPDKNIYTAPFSWFMSGVNNSARYLRITASGIGKTDLYEVAVYNGNKLVPIASSSIPEIVDEQFYARRFNNYLNSLSFDEIHYVPVAYQIKNKLPRNAMAHPPLGFLIIAASMSIFGVTPFAFRFPGALAGILMIPGIYLLANKLFKNKNMALFAAALLALDFMHFSMTRLAMLDPYPALFGIFALYFLADYIRRAQALKSGMRAPDCLPLVWSGVFFGLAGAAKWSGFYFAPGILLLLLFTWYRVFKTADNKQETRRVITRHFLVCVGAFIIIPTIIYYLSYVPLSYDLNNTPLFKYIIDTQKGLVSFHTNFDHIHPNGSLAITWPINYKPVGAFNYGEYNLYGRAQLIVVLGNPIIWWLGFLALVVLFGWALYSRRFEPVFIVTAFMASYIVWIFVSRQGFIFYYLVSIPYVILAICYWANFSWKKAEISVSKKLSLLRHWTQKLSAPLWSVLFGLIAVVATSVYYKRAEIVGEYNTIAQRVLSSCLALIIVSMIVISNLAWKHKRDVKAAKIKTMPTWAWLSVAAASFIMFIWFYPLIAGKTVTLKYAHSTAWLFEGRWFLWIVNLFSK